VVKFPTGGDEFISKPASRKAGFGAIPKPTVQSGWEKMEVPQTFKNPFFKRLFKRALKISLKVIYLRVFTFWGCLVLNFLFVRWITKGERKK
jgi:hypothetical protein